MSVQAKTVVTAELERYLMYRIAVIELTRIFNLMFDIPTFQQP